MRDAQPGPHPRPAHADHPHGGRPRRGARCRRCCAPSRDAGHPVVWACDPMHGNTFTAASGRKTRHFDDMIRRDRRLLRGPIAAEGTWPGGIHVELTGDNVTECLGGADGLVGRRPRRPLRDDVRPAPQRPPEPRPGLPGRRADRRLRRLTRALELVATWPVPHVSAAVVGADGSVIGRTGEHGPPLPPRLADQADDGVGDARRRRGGDRRPRPTGRPARLHAAPSAGPRRRLPVRRRRADRCARRGGGSTPTPASRWSRPSVADAAGMPFAEYLADAVFDPLGMTGARLEGSAAHAAWASVDDVARFLGRDPATDAARRSPRRQTRSGRSGRTLPVSCPAWADSIRARGDWGSRSGGASPRTGPG